jgi:hypothetical protein
MAYQFSDNEKYIIKKSNPHILYTNTAVSPHPWLKLQSGNIVKDGRTYYPFAYKHTLDLNDCLQFAESLSIGEIGYAGRKCVLREKGSSLLFGYTDEQNIAIATGRGSVLNESANPNLGESYAIVRHAVVAGNAPYHIAYVMFKDGSTNVTLEADAGNVDLTHPVFDMYSTTDAKETFHRRYVDSFTPASTIVLTKR